MSNDISILISLGVIVKCLPAAGIHSQCAMLIMVSILVFTFHFIRGP